MVAKLAMPTGASGPVLLASGLTGSLETGLKTVQSWGQSRQCPSSDLCSLHHTAFFH